MEDEELSVNESREGVYQLLNGVFIPSGLPREVKSVKGPTDRLSNADETFLEKGSAAHVELKLPIDGMDGRGGDGVG